MKENYNKEERYIRAKKRVEDLKGFYIHFSIYIIINLAVSSREIFINVGFVENFLEVISDFGTFSLWVFWGIGVAFHALRVFGTSVFLGKNWEERKIKEYLDNQDKI